MFKDTEAEEITQVELNDYNFYLYVTIHNNMSTASRPAQYLYFQGKHITSISLRHPGTILTDNKEAFYLSYRASVDTGKAPSNPMCTFHFC